MKKFIPDKILYEEDTFQIAWGLWDENGSMCLGVRWPNWPPPHKDGDQSWLVIPEKAGCALVSGILNLKGTIKSNLLQVLPDIIRLGKKR